MSVSVGENNAGIIGYFKNKFKKNICFRNSAVIFYNEIHEVLKKNNPCKTSEQSDCYIKRPSIEDHVGKGSKYYLDEGWLLKLALKHSKGDPEAALELIGMCGHDDTEQGKFSYIDKSESAVLKNKKWALVYIKEMQQVDNELAALLKSNGNNEKILLLKEYSKSLAIDIQITSESKSYKEKIRCPTQNSDFYLPGSLSNNANISSNLVSKIKNVQAGGKDASFIAAKHYRVYGSAFLGCKMVQNGLKPREAILVQKQAARLYRGLRMCESVNTLLMERNMVKTNFNKIDIENTESVERNVLKIWDLKNNKKIDCNIAQNTDQNKFDPQCRLLFVFGIANLTENEKNIAQLRISKYLVRTDVAMLYQNWYFGGGSIGVKKLPCSDIRYKGPVDLMNPTATLFDKIYKPNGWSDERYLNATKKLATWDVDFEWTIAQHEAGSKFGAKICSESKDKKNLFEEKSCTDLPPSKETSDKSNDSASSIQKKSGNQ